MTHKSSSDKDEIIRRLEVLVSDVLGIKATPPARPEDVLNLLATGLARSRGNKSLLARIEHFAWRISSPIWDFRIRRQIRLVRELADNAGWNSSTTLDAIMLLDDQVFARTYGRMEAAPIKRIVRQIAASGAMATHELKSLVIGRCFQVDQQGRVTVPVKPWVFSLGVLQVFLATVALTTPIAIIGFSDIGLGFKFLASSIYVAPLLLAYWTFMRYFFNPQRLISRAQLYLPKLQIVSVS